MLFIYLFEPILSTLPDPGLGAACIRLWRGPAANTRRRVGIVIAGLSENNSGRRKGTWFWVVSESISEERTFVL